MIYLLLFYVLFSFTDLRIFIVMTYTITLQLFCNKLFSYFLTSIHRLKTWTFLHSYIHIVVNDTTSYWLACWPIRSQYAATLPAYHLPTVPSVRTHRTIPQRITRDRLHAVSVQKSAILVLKIASVISRNRHHWRRLFGRKKRVNTHKQMLTWCGSRQKELRLWLSFRTTLCGTPLAYPEGVRGMQPPFCLQNLFLNCVFAKYTV